jgi:hypothetical protein
MTSLGEACTLWGVPKSFIDIRIGTWQQIGTDLIARRPVIKEVSESQQFELSPADVQCSMEAIVAAHDTE